MTPTREQVIEWAREAGFQNAYFPPQFFDPLERLCTLAMSAGRDQGLREAKEVCEVERDMVPRDVYNQLQQECDYWKSRAKTMWDHAQGTCWYWMGDGEDHPESMVNSLPVVIRADQLRELLNTAVHQPLAGAEVDHNSAPPGYRAVVSPQDNCDGCAFDSPVICTRLDTWHGSCCAEDRKDNTSVIFVKL